MDITTQMSQKIFYEEESNKSLEGKLLVASPHLDDPYFGKALIYVCAHDASGAIGVVINQRIGMISYNDFMFNNERSKISSTMKQKKFPLMFGGPVNTDILIALSLKNKDSNTSLQNSDIAVQTDINKFFKDLIKKNKATKFLLVKGVSVWDKQQLEEEIEENTWFVTDATPDMIFSQKPKDKWAFNMKKLGIINHYELVHYSGNG